MQKAKRRLTKFNFEAEGSHIALVHKKQGGPANGYNYAVVLKSTDDISEEEVKELLSQEVDKGMSSSEGVTNQTEGKTLSEQENNEDHMSEEMIAKSVMEAEIAKAVDSAVAKAVAEKEVEKEAAVAAKQSELDSALAIVKSFEEKEKESIAKSRKEILKQAGVAEEQVETLYKSTEALDSDAFAVVAKAMAAQNKALEESDLLKEKGVSGEAVAVEVDGVEALTKALEQQYNKAK